MRSVGIAAHVLRAISRPAVFLGAGGDLGPRSISELRPTSFHARSGSWFEIAARA